MALEDDHTSHETSASTMDASSSESATAAETSLSIVEAAFERAEQQTQNTGKSASGASAISGEQAAVTDSSASTPTETDRSDTPVIGEHDGTSGSDQNDSTPPADADPAQQQSLTPPDSWPKERREQFETLPEQGKSLLMNIFRDMERGVKQTFDKLATERKAIKEQFGFEADQIQSLTDRARTFQSDPVSVISQLAEEAGIDVYFKDQSEQMPDFEDGQDLAKWLLQKTRQEARQAAVDEAKTLKQQQQQAAVKQKLDAEFAEAYRAHPDMADHQEAIIKYISGFNLPVEMAYRLATYEGLTQLAQNGQTSLAELNKSKAELEKLQKLATMPPVRADARHKGKANGNGMDLYSAAMERAEQSLNR